MTIERHGWTYYIAALYFSVAQMVKYSDLYRGPIVNEKEPSSWVNNYI